MQLPELGFDLRDGDRSDLRVSPQVVLKNLAYRNQEVRPAGVAVDLVDGRVRENLGEAFSELFDVDLGQTCSVLIHSVQGSSGLKTRHHSGGQDEAVRAGDGLRLDARPGQNPALSGLGTRQPYPKRDKLKKTSQQLLKATRRWDVTIPRNAQEFTQASPSHIPPEGRNHVLGIDRGNHPKSSLLFDALDVRSPE